MVTFFVSMPAQVNFILVFFIDPGIFREFVAFRFEQINLSAEASLFSIESTGFQVERTGDL